MPRFITTVPINRMLLDQTNWFSGYTVKQIRAHIKKCMAQLEEMGIELRKTDKMHILFVTTILPPKQWTTVAKAIRADRHDMLVTIQRALGGLISDIERGLEPLYHSITTGQLAALMRAVGKLD